MNKDEAAKYANLCHEQLLDEFPDLSRIKAFSIAIRSYFNEEIGREEFIQILHTANIPRTNIEKALQIIETENQIKKRRRYE